MDEITPPMRKGYLHSWKVGENHVTDFLFTFTPEKAAVWETRQEAENDCTAIYNHFGINIDVVGGGTLLCRGF